MKFSIPEFKPGQLVKARVEEVLSSGVLIVTFNGDLLRVNNHTEIQFESGSSIDLQVRSLRPLSFRLFTGRKAGGLSVSV